MKCDKCKKALATSIVPVMNIEGEAVELFLCAECYSLYKKNQKRCVVCKKKSAVIHVFNMYLCRDCYQKEIVAKHFNTDSTENSQLKKDIDEALDQYIKSTSSKVDVDLVKGLLGEAAKDIEEAIKGLALTPEQVKDLMPEKACPKCGMTWEDVKKISKLGCPKCYDIFKGDLELTLRRIQCGAEKHIGKVPNNMGKFKKRSEIDEINEIPEVEVEEVPIEEQIKMLEAELVVAVNEEKYEKAAELRDRINLLKKEENK